MGLEANVINRLDNNNVLVEISNTKTDFKKHFSVPEDKADTFVASYKKDNRNVSIISNTLFAASCVAGVMLTNVFTRKLDSKPLRWFLALAGGAAASVGSFIGTDKYIEAKQKKLLNNFQAQEIKM